MEKTGIEPATSCLQSRIATLAFIPRSVISYMPVLNHLHAFPMASHPRVMAALTFLIYRCQIPAVAGITNIYWRFPSYLDG